MSDVDIARRAEAALASDAPVEPQLVRELLSELAAQRALADERWQAIAKLAPAAKRHRAQLQDLARLALEATTALTANEPALAARLAEAARAALPDAPG